MYTYTNTRTGVLVDQVDLFLARAGIADDRRKPIVDAIDRGEIDRVAAYVTSSGQRVFEGAIDINWTRHSDLADVSVSSDLPGWEDDTAPELVIVADRIHQEAQRQGSGLGYSVRWNAKVLNNPELLEIRRNELQVGPNQLPDWKKDPFQRRIPLQDLMEAHVELNYVR